MARRGAAGEANTRCRRIVLAFFEKKGQGAHVDFLSFGFRWYVPCQTLAGAIKRATTEVRASSGFAPCDTLLSTSHTCLFNDEVMMQRSQSRVGEEGFSGEARCSASLND